MAGKQWRVSDPTRGGGGFGGGGGRRRETSMEKFLVPVERSIDPPKPIKRRQWKRSTIELDGRMGRSYRHDMAGLVMQSYSEVGAFPHLYHVDDGSACMTHVSRLVHSSLIDYPKSAISALDFDNKGYYLASVTKSGCLTIHDFEALYCQSFNKSSPCSADIESKNVMHISLDKHLDVVRWNIADQDEVACASNKGGEVLVFDIGYVSSEPVEVLREKHIADGSGKERGFSDIAFASNDRSRLFGAHRYGRISVWDRRASTFPCLRLMTISHDVASSIQLNFENQTIFGASGNGMIYMWDLRGGRTSASIRGDREACYAPFTTVKLAAELEKIGSLKAQCEIASSKIHSIGLNPSCPHQLAFHLDDGWSGVLDIYNLCVTHLHCPPPPWLNHDISSFALYNQRRASWLPTISIYAVGSANENGIYLLDFFPDATSPSHVDYNEERSSKERKQNRFIPLSEAVISCAAHPVNGTIIAGTKESSLVVLSQKQDRC